MKGSKKVVIFSTAFFMTFAFFVLVSNLFSVIVSEASLITIWSIYSFTFYFFLFINAFIRKLFINKELNGKRLFTKGKLTKFTFREKSWLYLGPFLIYFLPALKSRSLEGTSIYNFIMFLITIVLLELLLKLSERSLIVYFTNAGVFINGLDLRLFIPNIYGSILHNDSGIYEFNSFKNFYRFSDRIELYFNLDQGKIEILGTSDELSKTEGVLLKNKIKIRKF